MKLLTEMYSEHTLVPMYTTYKRKQVITTAVPILVSSHFLLTILDLSGYSQVVWCRLSLVDRLFRLTYFRQEYTQGNRA